ncbi:MAG: hypothetical protein IKI29_02745 [Clostridia bacterium]|nr:hypothetical protein [Clostridia bacterium]
MFVKRLKTVLVALAITISVFTALGVQTVCAQTAPQMNGDYNDDSTVDIRDLVHLKKYLISLQQNGTVDYDVIDANTDVRHISAEDLVAIRKYLMGDSSAFDALNDDNIIIIF